MTKKQRKMLVRIIIAAVLMLVLAFLPVIGILRFVLYLVPYLVAGYDILRKAFKGIINGQVFDECFLMAVATIGAMAIAIAGDGDYTEAIAVMLFYQIENMVSTEHLIHLFQRKLQSLQVLTLTIQRLSFVTLEMVQVSQLY